MNNLKANYVVIVKNGGEDFEKVKALSKINTKIEYSDKGWFSIIGNFDVKKLEGYEFYDVKSDWNTASGFQDRSL